jgi:NADPH-dependent curcumin reductase CurA
MAPSQSLQITLAHRPTSGIIPNHTFAPVTVPVPSASSLAPGQLLLETLYLSLDPAMRGWIEDKRSYLPPVKIGAVMRAYGLARVLASTSSRAQPGDLVAGAFGMAEVVVVPEALVEEVNPGAPGGKITDALGVLGMTGLTAYFGMTKIGMPKEGETVVVTAAAGATGSVAAQIAKIAGARVVGIAGSKEKVDWLTEEVGVDVGLNYNDPEFKKKFEEATPKFVDVFWDNGGFSFLGRMGVGGGG